MFLQHAFHDSPLSLHLCPCGTPIPLHPFGPKLTGRQRRDLLPNYEARFQTNPLTDRASVGIFWHPHTRGYVGRTHFPRNEFHLDILLVCRQIYEEAWMVLWAHNVFSVTSSSLLTEYFLPLLSERQAAAIRAIVATFCVEEANHYGNRLGSLHGLRTLYFIAKSGFGDAASFEQLAQRTGCKPDLVPIAIRHPRSDFSLRSRKPHRPRP